MGMTRKTLVFAAMILLFGVAQAFAGNGKLTTYIYNGNTFGIDTYGGISPAFFGHHLTIILNLDSPVRQSLLTNPEVFDVTPVSWAVSDGLEWFTSSDCTRAIRCTAGFKMA